MAKILLGENIKLCPKCLDREEVAMKRISVSEAISKTESVGSLFSRRYMYLPYRCPKCKSEQKYSTYRWRFLEGSWCCMKCENAETIKEGRKKVQGNIIEVDYHCEKCGNKWTTGIEYYC